MTHEKRNRISVDRNGKWRLYSPLIPPGWDALGTVTDGSGRTGALMRNKRTGIYSRVNAGVVASLPQSKIAAALEAE
jgi:hypothetical protein